MGHMYQIIHQLTIQLSTYFTESINHDKVEVTIYHLSMYNS